METSYVELTIRLSLALLLGGAIGIEREYRAKEAGFRTHFLVALGSALFCIVSQYGFGVDLKDCNYPKYADLLIAKKTRKCLLASFFVIIRK